MTFTPFTHPALDLEAKKDSLEREIMNAVFDAVNENKLDIANLQTVSQSIWTSLQAIKTEQDLQIFKDRLGQDFPYLSSITLQNQTERSAKEKNVMEKLSSAINSQSN